MKVLISSDPHPRLNTLGLFVRYLAAMEKAQEAHKPELVVVLGDLFHNHAVVRSEILNLWIDYLGRMSTPHILMSGNHDETFPGSGVSAVSALAFGPHRVVPHSGPLMHRDGGNSLAFVSYVHTEEEFKRRLAAVEMLCEPRQTILFVHQTFQGAQYENGMYAPDGFNPQLVEAFPLVIGGHIHKRQGFCNIQYPGTPYAQGFSDAYENKFLWLFDTETLLSQPIDIGMPRYAVLTGTVQEFTPAVVLAAGNYYKLVVRGTRVEIQAFQKSALLAEWRTKYNIVVSPQYTDHASQEQVISESISFEQMLGQYVASIVDTSLDRERLLKTTQAFLRG